MDHEHEWMARGLCTSIPPVHVLPERRRRGGGGPQDLRRLPGAGGVPRARPRQPHRPRRVGRLLRAGAPPDPQAARAAGTRPSVVGQRPLGRGQALGLVASSSSSSAVLDALLELVLGLTERPGQLRQLGAAEEHEDDDQDDEQLWSTEVHGVTGTSRPPAGTASRRGARLGRVLECVVNISEGRDAAADRRARRGRRRRPARRPHRPAPPPLGAHPGRRGRARARWPTAAVERLDLAAPRRRAPAPRGGRRRAVRAARRQRRWPTRVRGPGRFAALARRRRTACPCFLYGPERTLPEVRRGAFRGPRARRRARRARTPPPAPRASAPARCSSPTTCGSPTLDLARARAIAAGDPRPELRALGLPVGDARAGVDEPRRPARGSGPADGLRPRGDAAARPRRVDRARRAGGAGARGGAATRSPPARGRELDLARRPHDRGAPGARRDASRGVRRSAGATGEGPLAAEAAALPLAHAAPDAELLAVGERVLEAVLAHDAAAADLLGLPGGRTPLGEEQVGVDAEAVGVVLPGRGRRVRWRWGSARALLRGGTVQLARSTWWPPPATTTSVITTV